MELTRKNRACGAAVILGASMLLTGCAGGGGDQRENALESSPTASTKDKDNALPGMSPGEIPEIPVFEVPDISLLLASSDNFNIDATKKIKSSSGVKVEPATCDGTELSYENGTIGGDGSANFWTSGKGVSNNGDGSGIYTKGGTVIQNNGDGSGTYMSNGVFIDNDGNGGGTYQKGGVTIQLTGDGGGTYSRGDEQTQINNDGSGTYNKGVKSIINNGDGSGSYTDSDWYIEVAADGTAQVSKSGGETKSFKAKPLEPLAKVGTFARMDSISPVDSCGTKITLSNAILFRVEDSTIDPEAKKVLNEVAGVLKEGKVPAAKVYGHTDSVNSDEENLVLSQERALSVVTYLTDQGVTSSLIPEGMGEKHPIANNINKNGSDNPDGRAKNRRVEIFIPTF